MASIRHILGGFGILCLAFGLMAGCGHGRFDEHLKAGLDALRAGRYGEARSNLETAARLQADSTVAHGNLGVAYWMLGMTNRALDSLAFAVDLGGGDERVLELLADIHREGSRFGEARRLLNRVDEATPNNPRVLTKLALVDVGEGRMDSAIAQLKRALDADAGYPPSLYNLGVIYRDYLNEPAAALRYFWRYLETETLDPHVDKAREAMEALRRGETSPTALPGVGGLRSPATAAAGPGRPAAATAAAAVPAVPAVAAVASTMDRARAALKADAVDEALTILRSEIQANPNNADALWMLAQLYEGELSNPVRARETYVLFVERFPGEARSAQARRRLGVTPEPVPAVSAPAPVVEPAPVAEPAPVVRVREPVLPSPAVEAPRPAAAATPASVRPAVVAAPPVEAAAPTAQAAPEPAAAGGAREAWARAAAAVERKDWATAEAGFRRVLALSPKTAEAAYQIGLIRYQGYRDRVGARTAFKQALGLDREMAKASYMAALMSRDLKQNQDAAVMAQRAIALRPDYARAHYLLGVIYRDAGRRQQAVDHLRLAVRHASDRDTADVAQAALRALEGPVRR